MWQLFSIVATLLPAIGFAFSAPQLFSLVAPPGLIGATMRFPYTFAVGIFGGRNWTIISALLLLIPTVMLGIIIQNPDTPYWQFALAAALGGFGRGNFSSSMANISYFFPNEQKGTALGINAAGGNLGVGIVQLLVPFAITVGAVGAVSAVARRPGRRRTGPPRRSSYRMRPSSGCRSSCSRRSVPISS